MISILLFQEEEGCDRYLKEDFDKKGIWHRTFIVLFVIAKVIDQWLIRNLYWLEESVLLVNEYDQYIFAAFASDISVCL